MDELAQAQNKTGEAIEQVISTYTEDSSSRKTLPYLEERLRRLTNLWDEFESRDNIIRINHPEELSHLYYVKDYYNGIRAVYEKYQDQISTKIQSYSEIDLPRALPAASIEQLDMASEQLDVSIDNTILSSSKKNCVQEEVLGQPTQFTTRKEGHSTQPLLTSTSKGARRKEHDSYNNADASSDNPTEGRERIPPPIDYSSCQNSANTDNDLNKIIRRQRVRLESLRRLLQGIQANEHQSHSRQYYECNINTIERYWSQIEASNNEIWELSEEPASAGYNIDEYYNFEERVQSIIIKLSYNLAQCSMTNMNDTPNNNVSMKLPRIVIPIFDGDYLKWRQFYDLFAQMVHNQPMSACQKMWYLKTNLRGEAEKLIRHLSLTNENYTTAWEMLKARYDNTRLLVTALLNKLLSQPKLLSENASTLKSLHDTTKEAILGLENLKVKTINWDPLLLHILIGKLDRMSHSLYEQSLDQPRALQSVHHFLNFLETRFQSLEALGSKGKVQPETHRKPNQFSRRVNALVSTNAVGTKCVLCNENHQLFACQKFLQLTPTNRLKVLRNNKLCVNCLRAGHTTSNCTLRECTNCSKKHNTLVHIQDSSDGKPHTHHSGQLQSSNKVHQGDQSVTLTAGKSKLNGSYVLLSTVTVKLTTDKGDNVECRAILDSGSQVNLVTERIVKKLGLSGVPDIMKVQGIGQVRQQANRRVNVLMQSRVNGFSTRLEAFILKEILAPQPSQCIDTSTWLIPQNIKLADPVFDKPGHIDLLIGAEYYYQLLSVGQIKLGNGLPTLQNTVLGWVLAGKIDQMASNQKICGILSKDQDIDQQLEKFWHLEEATEEEKSLTLAEKRCEEHFNQTVRRDQSGRFIVRLPFLDDTLKLGESKEIASRRFLAIEQRLAKNNELRSQYIDFMEEYRRLGHMQEINFKEIGVPYYFIPHHCVSKPESTTTKLRVVFDASCKTSSNLSLNDIMAAGPTIQDDLFSILLRFRQPRFVFTADIEKMYRQILIDERERQFQLIYWRRDPSHSLKCYQLNTVTYGTTSAPYLATKCLQRLAQEEAATYPLGAQVLTKDFYVDDVMSGSKNLSTALEMQTQLKELLSKGGFKLRKWCANHPRLLRDIHPDDRAPQLTFNDGNEEQIKILGLTWIPTSDSFSVKTAWIERNKITKRTVCSDVARIFDPLGIMSPVVVTAKIFLQELWALKMDWDASLPMELHTKWTHYREGLQSLNDIRFPRQVLSEQPSKNVQIHTFADASQRAYGAAVYIRSTNKDKQIVVRLLCAKSKVAPLKQITLPRLELCAAKLAAELTNRVKNDLNFKNEPTYYWTDSEIVLGWLNSPSSSYQTFVANRVSSIQSLSIPEQWRHVRSEDNPADCLTRGLTPERLKSCNMWLYGPLFLYSIETFWPQPYVKKVECNIEKKRLALPLITDEISTHFVQNIDHKNSFSKLKRITGYIIRFVNKLKDRRQGKNETKDTVFTTQELQEALMIIIKVIQQDQFKEEIKQLNEHKELARNSPLNTLTPFLDERGIMRVGGRLQAANVSYDTKHPILLPYSHQLTKLLMTNIHNENLHVGPQTLLSITRQQFWPIKGKTIARSIVQHCVQCTRAKPNMLSQMMGNLPSHRVQPARPFINAGVDFCGPVWTHFKTRGKRPQKTYIAVFCCFATKATHLEVVSDLSTQAFLGALKRFMARRGHCSNIYCDNATNFVGARNELQELKQSIYSHKSKLEIATACESNGIDFHFIPPRAPHFGGLWEAAVKSAKYLLKRTVANAALTYEELETVIVQIEAILNSRPITPMSSDPNDLSALTPGHFLIGEPLTNNIDPYATPERANLLTRWKLVTHLKNEFWKRWSREYLNELQQRHKWKHPSQNIQPDSLVIIREENVPSLKWPLGRIIKVIKGDDGLVRVADVRVGKTIVRRPIHKLAPLPSQDEETTTPTELTPTNDVGGNQPVATSASFTTTQDTLSTDVHTNPRKRARLSIGHTISTILLTCLFLPGIFGSPIETTHFKSSPGLHFENLGSASIISNEWDLIVYYDMTNYWSEFEGVLNGSRMLHDLCKRLTKEKSCTIITTQLDHLIDEIASNNELLLPPSSSTRTRRGAVNFIGNIANALFGVLDSEYAEKMSQTIEDVKSNEEHLLNLIKNQTTIIDATVNIMKKNYEQINQQFKEVEVQLNLFSNFTNFASEKLYQEELTSLFTSVSIQVVLIVSNIQRAQFSIIDALTDTHHGRISPQLITPSQLKQELVQIRGHLPPTLRLPAEHVLQLYSLMKSAARATARHVIFKLTLPLLSFEKFELFRIIPIPALMNDTFISIKPSSKFLIINLHRDQYYPLTEQGLQSCISIKEDHHLCKQTHPIYKKGSSISSCEVSLMNEILPTTKCHIINAGDEPQWIQLNNPNQWMFAVRNKTNIKVVCGTNVTTATLEGAGILKLEEDCIIRQERITIQGHNIYPSIGRMSYSATSNITDVANPEQLSAVIPQMPLSQSHWQELQEIRDHIKQQLANSKLPVKLPAHDVHQFTVGYIAILLTILTAIYLIWKFRADICKPKGSKPIPQPRRSRPSDFNITIDA